MVPAHQPSVYTVHITSKTDSLWDEHDTKCDLLILAWELDGVGLSNAWLVMEMKLIFVVDPLVLEDMLSNCAHCMVQSVRIQFP